MPNEENRLSSLEKMAKINSIAILILALCQLFSSIESILEHDETIEITIVSEDQGKLK